MSDNFIPLSVPNLKGNELKYITEAIKTEWVSSGGPFVAQFENQFATYVGTKNAVSCQNGTAGLHTALNVLGVTKGDAVIVPTLTFIAAVNPVKYVDAMPIFMDCNDTLTMNMAKLQRFIEDECSFSGEKLIHIKTNKHIKALIIVHVFGNLADMSTLMQLSKKYNFKVIEDATEALGSYFIEGEFKHKHAGTIGDIGVSSFNGNKIITTGGGGMLFSHNEDYLTDAKHLTTQAKVDPVYFIHDEIGYNYRMTNIQAAIGIAQLEQLESFISTKAKNYKLYKQRLTDVKGLELLDFRSDIRPNYWFYALKLRDDFKLNRRELIDHFLQHQIQARPVWALIHEQKPYGGAITYKIEKAYEMLESIVNIPCSSNLLEDDVKKVIEVIKEA